MTITSNYCSLHLADFDIDSLSPHFEFVGPSSQPGGSDRGPEAKGRLPPFLPATDLFTGSVSLKLVDWRQPCPSF